MYSEGKRLTCILGSPLQSSLDLAEQQLGNATGNVTEAQRAVAAAQAEREAAHAAWEAGQAAVLEAQARVDNSGSVSRSVAWIEGGDSSLQTVHLQSLILKSDT